MVVRAIRNSQDEYHARDPEKFPRTAKTAYHMDGKELNDVFKEAEEDGWTVAAYYHSHPDRGAYFSEEDRRKAVYQEKDETTGQSSDKPVWPDNIYLIIGFDGKEIYEFKAFHWDPDVSDFVEAPVVAAGPA